MTRVNADPLQKEIRDLPWAMEKLKGLTNFFFFFALVLLTTPPNSQKAEAGAGRTKKRLL